MGSCHFLRDSHLRKGGALLWKNRAAREMSGRDNPSGCGESRRDVRSLP
jgi:hypothetical protein